MAKDKAKHKVKYIIRKYNTEEAQETGEPDEISEFEENVFLDEGIAAIWDALTGLSAVTTFNESNSYIGVGDGADAEDSTQTGLLGSNIAYIGMDTGYPSRTDQTVTWRATFGDTDANFDWKEFTVANGSSNTATNINRKQTDQGTKSSGSTWELEVQLTIS